MSQRIKNVAVAGATGNVGDPALQALLETGAFDITVLVRPGSTHSFPDGVRVTEVDLASLPSLAAALRGQDALVNATSIQDPSAHIIIVDAGVYRLVLADFGSDPARVHAPPRGRRRRPWLTWIVVSNGPFLDWNMANGFMGLDVRRRRAQLLGGDVVKSQKQLLALAREALGAEGWEVEHEDNAARYAWAMAEMGRGNFDLPVIMH
ncbi:putative isoflavone reductase family protein CipA [Xylariaceae sp. FL0016]|nr:putative isoflavone reductase family protein CipA [Xylariaceae sp. FL0016]